LAGNLNLRIFLSLTHPWVYANFTFSNIKKDVTGWDEKYIQLTRSTLKGFLWVGLEFDIMGHLAL